MSWYRQIKTFYTISINMFFFIIWAIVSTIFLTNKLDYKLYFISLAAAFALQFLASKIKNRNFAIVLAIVIGMLMVLMTSKGLFFILNSIFIIFIVLMVSSFEDEDINYEAYKSRARNGLIFILFMGILMPFVDLNLSKSILKFYIMYLISNIVVMREARSYAYKLRNKQGMITNALISIVILLMSVDRVFNLLIGAIKAVLKLLNIILDKIIELLGFILAKPLVFITEKLRAIMQRGMDNFGDPSKDIQDAEQAKSKIPWDNQGGISFPDWLVTGFKICLMLLILYIIFLIILRLGSYYSDKGKNIVEEREKIKRGKTRKDNFIKRMFKELFRPSDLRGQVLNIYRKFQQRTFDKGIFKRNMTARQLENVTKTYIEKSEGIDKLTEIYNEAKFSEHVVTESKVKTIKEKFDNIKNQF